MKRSELKNIIKEIIIMETSTEINKLIEDIKNIPNVSKVEFKKAKTISKNVSVTDTIEIYSNGNIQDVDYFTLRKVLLDSKLQLHGAYYFKDFIEVIFK